MLDHIKEKTALNKYSLALNIIDSLMNVSASRDFRFNLYEQKLTIFGRIYKLERYLEELKNISVLYPEKAEFFSKKVEYVQNIIEKNKVLYKDNEYVLVYTDIEDSESQLTKKYDFVKEPYKNNVYLTVKYGFLNIEEAEKFADSITQNKKILSNNKYFVFSTAQYINMLIFKTLDIIKN